MATTTKMGKQKVRYDKGAAPLALTNAGTAEPVTFLSEKKNLKVLIYEQTTDDTGRPYFEEIPIVFAGAEYRTTNQNLIDRLRSHENFGGSHSEDFANAGGKTPMFWEGGYPRWHMDKENKRREGLVEGEGTYEPGG